MPYIILPIKGLFDGISLSRPCLVFQIDREYAQTLVDRCEQSGRLSEWGNHIWSTFLTIEDPPEFWWFNYLDVDLFEGLGDALNEEHHDAWRKIIHLTRELRPLVLPDEAELVLPGETYEELYGSDDYIKTGTQCCNCGPLSLHFTAGVHPLQTEITTVGLSVDVLREIAQGTLDRALPARADDWKG
jgi:hypothetical protein